MIEIAGMGFVLGLALLILVLVVVIIWQGSRIAQTKMKVDAEMAGNEAYRKLAEEAVSVQQKMAEDISDIRERMTAIEKLLREVE